MTLADKYREAYNNALNLPTVADYLHLVATIDPDAIMAKRDLGVYIVFTDGSCWRLGTANRNAGVMLS